MSKILISLNMKMNFQMKNKDYQSTIEDIICTISRILNQLGFILDSDESKKLFYCESAEHNRRWCELLFFHQLWMEKYC